MITVDASAIVAILLSEPEESAFRDLIREAGGGVISPVNHWEVLVRMGVLRGERGRQVADQLMVALKIEVKDATRSHSEIAATAQSRFGKTTPAKLNLGDCFAYALAAIEGDGLLFKGDDFPKTDVKRVAA